MLADFLTVTKYASRFIPVFLLADCLTVTKSAGRFSPPQFLQADFLIVTKSAGRFIPLISAGRFPDSHQICWEIYPPNFWQADFLTSTKSAGRFLPNFCWVIFSQSPNLPSRFIPLFLLADLSHTFLLADFLTVTKWCQQIYPPISAGRFIPHISTDRFSHSQQICWQFSPPPPFLIGRLSESPKLYQQIYPPPISAGRFSDSHQIFWQIYLQFPLEDFLTVTKSVGRVTPNFCWQIF